MLCSPSDTIVKRNNLMVWELIFLPYETMEGAIFLITHHVLANEMDLNFKYHIGLNQCFNINLGIGIIKKLLFCSYFRHISLCFYSNFDRESSLDVEFDSESNSTSNELSRSKFE